MPSSPVPDAPPSSAAGAQAVRALLLGLRELLLRFLLPVAGVGLVLWGAEEALLAFGVHGDLAKMLRYGVLPLYGLMVFRLLGRKGAS